MTTSEIATLSGYEEFAPWLLVEKTGNVHVVSINRPEAFNAVNEEVHHAFATIWRVLAADDDQTLSGAESIAQPLQLYRWDRLPDERRART